MPKKTKSQTESESFANPKTETAAPTSETVKPAAIKRATKTTPASRKAPAKKKPARKTPKAKPAVTASEPQDANEPSDEEIRIRAYFIAERRAQLSLHGDPALDWIEARQQLLQEARQAQS